MRKAHGGEREKFELGFILPRARGSFERSEVIIKPDSLNIPPLRYEIEQGFALCFRVYLPTTCFTNEDLEERQERTTKLQHRCSSSFITFPCLLFFLPLYPGEEKKKANTRRRKRTDASCVPGLFASKAHLRRFYWVLKPLGR